MNYSKAVRLGLIAVAVAALVYGIVISASENVNILPPALYAALWVGGIYLWVFSVIASVDLWLKKSDNVILALVLATALAVAFITVIGVEFFIAFGISLIFGAAHAIILNCIQPAQKPSESTKESSDA